MRKGREHEGHEKRDRATEIAAWLSIRRSVIEAYVILDDEAVNHDRLVRVDLYEGLSRADCAAARALLIG